jgi:Holliday junction resolvase-like predicted endonuclease
MSDLVESFLDTHGPRLSSEVAEYLVKTLGISPVAARKRVSRLAGNVRRLGYLTFPRKARYMYLEQQFGSPQYWENLVEALMLTKSAYGHAIAALRQRGGAVPERLFPIVCGSPVKQLKHLSAESVLKHLIEAGLFQRVALPGLGDCIVIVQAEGYYHGLAEMVRTRLITEGFLLTAVSDWLKKLGIVSYGKVATRDGDALPRVGTFAWDLTAPSYLGPMVKSGKEGKDKPGFVVCDVYLGDYATVEGVRPFVTKCRTLRGLRNIGPCLQIFVAGGYSGEAFKLLKENGIVPATPANLFGEEIAAGLKQLSSVLTKAAALSTIDPTAFDELFSKFGKIEGAANQLRGTLFEYLAADILRKTGAHQVRMNRIFKQETKEAEADVIAVRDNLSLTFIECKGHSPYGETPHEEVEKWLQHNVPIFFKSAKEHADWKNLPVHFEFWTTAPLTEKSIQFLEKAKASIKPTRYTIGWCLGPEVLTLCKGTKDDGLATAFRKHFMKYNAKSAALAVAIWPQGTNA